jgi:hypothetical protein
MIDFTVNLFCSILDAISKKGLSFRPIQDILKDQSNYGITIRHDVDLIPINALRFAKIMEGKGIKGTFYFRIVPESFDNKIIQEVYELGHEVGYHYEDVSLMAKRHKGITEERKLVEFAIKSFTENLEKMREIVPVKTICMHGNPISRWDNRLLWEYYDYHDFNIIGEPYFDVDFKDMLYLTDTGRRWNGGGVSVRDKAQGSGHRAQGEEKYQVRKVKPIPGSLMNMTTESLDFQNKYKFRSTSDIIEATEKGDLPDKIMMTLHPQRWTNKPLPWIKELVWQNVKNVGKYFLINLRQ